MNFSDLNLDDELLRALHDEGYEQPTPIQTKAIPPLLAGQDVLGIAQTGTGKTAAFTLPILQHIAQYGTTRKNKRIRALVVTPTRELAAQIGVSIETYGAYLDTTHTVVFGGVKQGNQVKALKSGVDLLVATPGRLLDLEDQGYISLDDVEFLVLDEADRMLDMGFIHDIKRIVKKLPDDRQNLLFSATLPKSIESLAKSFLHDPVHVEIETETPTVESIAQSVMFVRKADKKNLLVWAADEFGFERTIVFSRTKHGANKLVKILDKKGISAVAIHGNKSQGARTRALENFKNGEVDLLIATDVASRGLDIDKVEFVVNYDLPNDPETYVHRIGRTGRAGEDGAAISFCDVEEGGYLRDIERLIGLKIAVDDDHPYHDEDCIPSEDATSAKKKKRKKKSGGGSGGNSGGNNNRNRNNRRRRRR